MIKQELCIVRNDGVKLFKTYSDDNFKIRQIETGNIYDAAIDIENANFTYEETEEKVEVEAVKYSTLKIVRALGDEWPMYKQMMEQAGILDEFYTANYLKSDDPVFAAFIKQVPAELQAKLSECIWDAE